MFLFTVINKIYFKTLCDRINQSVQTTVKYYLLHIHCLMFNFKARLYHA